jgi:hypothetical protein
MLFYWGCGDRAHPGQPVVVDFASLSSGKVPPAFAQAALKYMTPPSAASHATYGEWPNNKSKTRVPAGGSLVGDHLVRGNYTPEIKFALAPGQDFLPPVSLTSQNPAAGGSVPLMWKPIAASRGWFLTTVGSADRCTVPQEVAKAAPQSMLSMVAFGPEANFSHPARPARAAASWKPEWAAKLRTKSTYMGMLGMDMASMMGGRDSDDADEAETEGPRPAAKSERIRRGLGRLLGN